MPSSKGLRMAPGVAERPEALRVVAPSPSLARILSWEIVWPTISEMRRFPTGRPDSAKQVPEGLVPEAGVANDAS